MLLLIPRGISFPCCLFVIVNFISQANGAVTPQQFHYFCDDNNDRGNYTTKSTYDTNLNTLLSTLTSNTEIDYGFYNSSYGQTTNKVNAIGLCRGDMKPDECGTCLDGSRANLTRLCPNRKEAIGWYEDEKCMLRYSDRNIFGLEEIGPAYYVNNLHNATDLNQFNLGTFLGSLKSKAAFGDSFKYEAGNYSGPNFQTIYGLVQCTPDLSGSECDDCLAQSIARFPIEKIGGRVVRPSCNMRIETSYLFYRPTAYAPPPPPSSTPTNSNTSSSQGGNSNTSRTAIGITVPVAAVVVVVLGVIGIYLRVRKPRKSFETLGDDDDDEVKIVESLQFNFDTIRDATNDFSDSNKLGQGGFGVVYKGMLFNGQEIAVKRLARNSSQGDTEFKNEVLLVAKLQHRNLVRLLGFCLEGREKLLVYEFAFNKSLNYFIFDPTRRAQLDWQSRYNIIGGIVRGLVYLHEDSRLRIIHRDLKASNILLDEEMSPKISDFGMARLFVVDQPHADTKKVVGTYGYMAPEYILHGQFSMKSDVFSFGVLLLEIVSGKRNSGNVYGENEEGLLSFVWRNWREERITNIVDPTLNNGSQNEITRCIHIGLLCVQENATGRPTMATILLMLNSYSVILPVPSEPAFLVNSRAGNLPEIPSVNYASITEPYPR